MPEPKVEKVTTTPMIMSLPPSLIIHAINKCLEEEQRDRIPITADISVRIPSGGDYSGEELQLDESRILLDIRWEK
jgi:hypothetical protein